MSDFPKSLQLLTPDGLTLPEILSAEDWMLSEADEGRLPESLMLWEQNSLAVVAGRNSSVHKEVHVARCASEGVPICRRVSGGGVVLLGPGCLSYSLFMKQEQNGVQHSIGSATTTIMQSLRDAIAVVVPELSLDGISDLTINGLKVSGNAQKWGRRFLLHHGTLLFNFDLTAVERYLDSPLKQPDYRRNRSHAEFVTNLEVNKESLLCALTDRWITSQGPMPFDREAIESRLTERYGNQEWIMRR